MRIPARTPTLCLVALLGAGVPVAAAQDRFEALNDSVTQPPAAAGSNSMLDALASVFCAFGLGHGGGLSFHSGISCGGGLHTGPNQVVERIEGVFGLLHSGGYSYDVPYASNPAAVGGDPVAASTGPGLTLTSYMGGISLNPYRLFGRTRNPASKVMPFINVHAGVAHVPGETSFAIEEGGGVDISLNAPVFLRLQAEFRTIFNSGGPTNMFIANFGVSFPIGKRK